jgi:catechol 2,3-dioxygenase-like lactoylglutathione lyase family enzyme
MARMHIHIAVDDLPRNIEFYSTLFGAGPGITKNDYAKWMLDDPKVNFAISTRGKKTGVDHIGIQSDNADEQVAIEQRLKAAGIAGMEQKGGTCCYAKSDKYWTTDPQGIPWETFHTLASAPTFNASDAEVTASESSCCAPSASACC